MADLVAGVGYIWDSHDKDSAWDTIPLDQIKDRVKFASTVDNDWVGAETPWLALDRNGNGLIDDGRELFGSMTELPDGRRAPNGFAALAALDDDGDGRITARDAAFARLLV